MLTLIQEAEYTRHKNLQTLFGKPANVTLINAFTPFQQEVADHVANIAAMEGYMPAKDIITTGTTDSKNALKLRIAANTSVYLDKTRAYALKYGNSTLAAAMDFAESDIYHLKDGDLLAFIVAKNALISPLITVANYIPYLVINADLTNNLADATAFNNLIGVATSDHSGSTVANTQIDDYIKKANENVVMFDLLINHWKTTNSAFVQAYHINSHVPHLGTHHNGVAGEIFNAANNDPIPGAIIKFVGTAKQSIADLDAIYSIIKIKSGLYQLECSAPGFITQTVTYHIRRGVIGSFDFHMIHI